MGKTRRLRWRIIGFVAAGLLILIILLQLGVLTTIANFGSTAFQPIQAFFTTAASRFQDFFVYFKDIKSITKQNQNLQDQITALMSENLSLKKQIDDSIIATKELEFIKEKNYNGVLAKIIGRSSDQYLQVLIINKGETDGIKVGYPVIVNQGYLIGKIIEVKKSSAKILLLNDNQSEVSAIIQNEQKSNGVVSGQYGLALKMQLIPQDGQVEQNQIVVTSGLEQYIPANLIIGKITKVTKISGELFQEALLEPLINYQKISIITIIKPLND